MQFLTRQSKAKEGISSLGPFLGRTSGSSGRTSGGVVLEPFRGQGMGMGGEEGL